MTKFELLPADTGIDQPSALRYQRKMGSLLYVAIITQLDVTFSVSQV